jgi:hypothetical protein
MIVSFGKYPVLHRRHIADRGMRWILVVEHNVVRVEFKQLFSVLRLNRIDLLEPEAAEEPIAKHNFDSPTLAAHREILGLQGFDQTHLVRQRRDPRVGSCCTIRSMRAMISRSAWLTPSGRW